VTRDDVNDIDDDDNNNNNNNNNNNTLVGCGRIAGRDRSIGRNFDIVMTRK
jgi:hypothetical protein